MKISLSIALSLIINHIGKCCHLFILPTKPYTLAYFLYRKGNYAIRILDSCVVC